MAAKTQAKIVLAGLCAVTLAACGTTVRHHGLASGGSGNGELSATTTGGTSADGTSAVGTTGAATGTGATGTGATGTGSSDGSTGATTGSGATGATTGSGSTGAATGSGTAGTGTTLTGTSTGSQPGSATSTAPSPSTGTTVAKGAKGGTRGTTSKSTTAARATASASPTAKGIPTGKATGSPVEIGIVYIADIGQYASSQGGSANAGNEQTEAQYAIDYVNAHGGLDGHVLAPVYYAFQLTDPSPYSTSMASICSSWTQDNHVSLGMFVGAAVPNDLANCLNQHGVAYISDGGYMHDATTYQQLPNMVSPSELDTSVAMKDVLDNLFATNALTTRDKVGVLVGDNEDAAGRAYTNVIVPMLKAKGISVSSYAVTYPESTADVVNTVTQVDNDELKMATDGVTRVLNLAPGVMGTFMGQADQQHYTPKYSLTSLDTEVGLTNATGSTAQPADQLANASGVGWNPTLDVGTYGKTTYDNATTKLCRSIEAPSGQDTGTLSDYATQVFCNAILSIQAAANASGAATLSGGALIGGYQALNDTYQDLLNLGTTLNASHHVGVNTVRPFAYSTGCSCFQYTSPAIPAY